MLRVLQTKLLLLCCNFHVGPSTTGAEGNIAFSNGEEGMVLAHINIFTGVEFCAPLAHNDIPRDHKLTPKFLHTEPTPFRIASVP